VGTVDDLRVYRGRAAHLRKLDQLELRRAHRWSRCRWLVLAANLPDAEIGRWIEDLHERARARKNLAELFGLSASNNPFVQFSATCDATARLSTQAVVEAALRAVSLRHGED
jgi:hypothetical protein